MPIAAVRIANAALLVCALSATAGASPIVYGNFSTPHYTWQGVQEDSPTNPSAPLFGAPSTVGDGVKFNPTAAFGASASNGANAYTDGQLSFSLVANPGQTISSFFFNERGDFTLLGNPTSFAMASVACNINFRVLDVNGIALGTPFLFSDTLTFTPSGGPNGVYQLTAMGLQNVAPWSGSLAENIDNMLAFGGIFGSATRMDVSLDNPLHAMTSAGTSASIFKKQIEGVSISVLPAPGAAALLGLGGLLAGRRRRN